MMMTKHLRCVAIQYIINITGNNNNYAYTMVRPIYAFPCITYGLIILTVLNPYKETTNEDTYVKTTYVSKKTRIIRQYDNTTEFIT